MLTFMEFDLGPVQEQQERASSPHPCSHSSTHTCIDTHKHTHTHTHRGAKKKNIECYTEKKINTHTQTDGLDPETVKQGQPSKKVHLARTWECGGMWGKPLTHVCRAPL